MANGYLYPGRVIRIDAEGPVVLVPLLGGDAPLGPAESAVPNLAVGDRVICGTLGASANDIRILGRTPGRTPTIPEIPGLPAVLDAHATRLEAVELDNATDQLVLDSHGTRITAAEAKNAQQDTRLDGIDGVNTTQSNRLTATEGVANAAAPATTLATLRADTAGRVTTKGDLLAGTAAGVLARQPVGVNGLALVADSAQATGLAYKDVLGLPRGLTGAVAPTRYVGATASAGAPTTGTFAVGDFVLDAAQHVWVCSVAGTPGTWVSRTAEQAARLTAQEGFEHYGWSGSGNCAHNDTPLVTGWPTAGVNNSGRMAGPNGTGKITLGRAGRWSIRMGAFSDHGAAGYTMVFFRWSGGAMEPVTDQADGRWHGSSFPGAGQAWQWAQWTGWVTAAQAAQSIFFYVYQINTASTAVTFNYYCGAEYMGGAA